jgi:hypothetical protein
VYVRTFPFTVCVTKAGVPSKRAAVASDERMKGDIRRSLLRRLRGASRLDLTEYCV